MNRVISSKQYNSVRKKLLSINNKIVKTGVQEMLHLFENDCVFSGAAENMKADFSAFILNILDNDDLDLRKWTYHLLCLYNFDNNNDIINSCIKNVVREADAGNLENISWIAAVIGSHMNDEQSFKNALYNTPIYDILSPEVIKLASSAFSIVPFYNLSETEVNQALLSGNGLSEIWLTKIFSNQFINYMKRNRYCSFRYIPTKERFAELLFHDNANVRKYAMWAFAQESGEMDSFRHLFNDPESFLFDEGVRKWYFTKLFQDKVFIEHNLDYIDDIRIHLRNYSTSVLEGILIGCEKLQYNDNIADFIIDWESKCSSETPLIIQVRLYEYIAANAVHNDDFKEIINSVVNNVDLERIVELSNIHIQINNMEENTNMGEQKNIFNVNGPMIYSEGGNNTQIINTINSDEIKILIEEIETLKEKIYENSSLIGQQYDQLLVHLSYELSCDRIPISKKYDKICSDIEELKSSIPNDRNSKLRNFLSDTADLLTITTAIPATIEFVKNVLAHIRNIL